MLKSAKFVAPIVFGAMLMTSVATTGASATMSFNPTLSFHSTDASVTKVWWHGGWRGGYGYRGFGYRGWGFRGPFVGYRGYGWRGGRFCYWHPRACWY